MLDCCPASHTVERTLAASCPPPLALSSYKLAPARAPCADESSRVAQRRDGHGAARRRARTADPHPADGPTCPAPRRPGPAQRARQVEARQLRRRANFDTGRVWGIARAAREDEREGESGGRTMAEWPRARFEAVPADCAGADDWSMLAWLGSVGDKCEETRDERERASERERVQGDDEGASPSRSGRPPRSLSLAHTRALLRSHLSRDT